MKTLTLSLTALIAICLPGCASYQAPEKLDMSSVPSSWKGNAGIESVGSEIEFSDGTYNEGEAIARYTVRHRRTATLSEPINKPVAIPRGAPLYAVQLTQKTTRVSPRGDTKISMQSAEQNPIEWCTPNPNKRGTICMLLENTTKAFYLENKFGSPLMPSLTYAGGGDNGILPIIDESQRPQFESQLYSALTIGPFHKKRVTVHHVIGTQEEDWFRGGQVTYRFSEWNESGRASVNMWGTKINLERIGESGKKPTAINVTFEEPPTVPTGF